MSKIFGSLGPCPGLESCKHNNVSSFPSKINANPDIAGVGVFRAFFATAFITCMFAIFTLLLEFMGMCCGGKERKQRRADGGGVTVRWRRIMEKMVISFSDQQLVTGLAMSITTRFYTRCDISVYHYDIVSYLLLCSVVTHLACITVVDNYFHSSSSNPSKGATWSQNVLSVVRVIGMLFTLVYVGILLRQRNPETFPVMHPASASLTDVGARAFLDKAYCYFISINAAKLFGDLAPDTKSVLTHSVKENWAHGLLQYVVLAFFTLISLFVAVMHSFGLISCCKTGKYILWDWIMWMGRAVIVGGATAIAVWMQIASSSLRNWMHASNFLRDNSEDSWSFGQYLAVLITLVIIPTLADAMADELNDRKELEKAPKTISRKSSSQSLGRPYSYTYLPTSYHTPSHSAGTDHFDSQSPGSYYHHSQPPYSQPPDNLHYPYSQSPAGLHYPFSNLPKSPEVSEYGVRSGF